MLAVGALVAVALGWLTGCSLFGAGDRSVLGCPFLEGEEVADGTCTSKKVIARACGLEDRQVSRLVRPQETGDGYTTLHFGEDQTVHGSIKLPLTGPGVSVVSCADPSIPNQTIEWELWGRLVGAGSADELPEWLQPAD